MMLTRTGIVGILLIMTILVGTAPPLYAAGNSPDKVLLQLPLDDGYVNTLTPAMTWNIPTDAEADPLHFKVAFATVATMAGAITIDSSVTAANFTPTPPLTNGQSVSCTFTPPAATYTQFSDGNRIYWTVTAKDDATDGATSDIWTFKIDVTAPVISNQTALNTIGLPFISPDASGLGDTAAVSFTVSETSSVTIQIFDATNVLKKTLVNANQYNPGAHSVTWDGTDDSGTTVVPDGIYTVKYNASDLAANNATEQTTVVTVDKVAPNVATRTPALINNPFSPNNDGKKDTVTLNWSLDAAASITAYIRRGSDNSLIRTISFNTATAAGDYSSVWDGLNDSAQAVAAGNYFFEIIAADSALNLDTLQVTVTLDLTGPVANPIDVGPDPFSPEVSGTRLSYTLDEDATVSVIIRNINNLTVRTLQTATLLTAGAQTLDWDGRNDSSTPLGDGTYRFVLSMTDKADNTTTAESTVKIDTVRPSLTLTSITPDPFSPNGDASKDTTVIAYTLSKEATVEVAIFNNLGVHQRTVEATLHTPSSYSPSWDGRDGAAATVPDGDYLVRINASDLAGNLAVEITGEVTVDNTAPTLTNLVITPTPFSPNASAGIRDSVSIRYDLSETGPVTLEIYNSSNVKVRSLVTAQNQNSGTRTATWDGKGDSGTFLADAGYDVRISATDAAGNSSGVLSGSVTVDNTKPTLTSVSATPSPFAPNGDGILDSTTVFYTVNDNSAQCTMEILVYLGALKIRDLQTPAPLATGARTIQWDGKDNSSVFQADGTYSIKLTATDEAGNTSDVSSINVVIDKGAPVLRTVRFLDNRNGIDTDDTLEITVSLPIDDTSVVGASVDDKFLLSGVGTFGAGAQIFTGKSPNDNIIEVRLGGGAVKPVQSADTLALKTGAIRSITGVASTDTNPRLVEDGTPPVLTGSIIFTDRGNDGINAGDTLTLTFDEAVSVTSTSVNGFRLYPSGGFGGGALVQQGSTADQVVIILGNSPTLTIKGVYGVDAGATGLEVQAGSAVVTDASGNKAIPNPVGTPLDLKVNDTQGPRIFSAVWEDTVSGASGGGLSSGDKIYITFDEPVLVTGSSIGDFQLPVASDSFGAGASYAVDKTKSVVITLGASPKLTVPGSYILGNDIAGNPSGIDINTTATGISDIGGNAAVANLPVDIQTTDTTVPKILSAKLTGSMGNNLIAPTIDLVTIQAIVDDSSLTTGNVTCDLSELGLTNNVPMTRLGSTTTFEVGTTVVGITGQKTIRVTAKDYSGNTSTVFSFTVQTVEPANTLIAEVNPSSVRKSAGTTLFRIHARPTFATWSKGIDELRVTIPINAGDPAAGYQYASSLEVFLGGTKLAGTEYTAAFSSGYLTIDFVSRITSATANPLIELRFALTVPNAIDTPTGKLLTVAVHQDDFPANYWQNAKDGDADGITDTSNSMKVVVNDLDIESVVTTLDFSSFFWRVNFEITLNAAMDTGVLPVASFLPQGATTINTEIPLQNMEWVNQTIGGTLKTVYRGYARIPVDNPEYRNNFTIFLRNFRDMSGVRIAEVNKTNLSMATGFIITAFENPLDPKDLVITLRSTTAVTQPFSLEITQPGDITEVIPPAKIVTYRQILFQAVYRLDPNFPGQSVIRVKSINVGAAPPRASLSLFGERVHEDGSLDLHFSEFGLQINAPAGAITGNSICHVIPAVPGMRLSQSGVNTMVNAADARGIGAAFSISAPGGFTRPVTFSVSVADVHPALRSKLFLAREDSDTLIPLDTRITGDRAICVLNSPGRIGLYLDEHPPTLTTERGHGGILIRVNDGGSGIPTNGVKADFGSITLAATQQGSNLWFVSTNQHIDPGVHEVTITAMDRAGNTSQPSRIALAILPAGELGRVEVFPSPARTTATIRYRLGVNMDDVSLRIYDSGGRLVLSRSLTGTFGSPLPYNEIWDLRDGRGRAVANGSYHFELRARHGDSLKIQRGRLAVLR